VLCALGLVGFAVPFVLGPLLFPLGSINRDEPMYVFSARLLRTGHLTLPASFAPYRPWASGVRGGRLVLKYTPVWPSVLAVGPTFGSMRIGVAVVSAGAVVLMGLLGRELFGRWREGLLAAALLLLSPLFLFQAATFLSYLFQLVLDLAILLLVLGALRRWPVHGPVPNHVVFRLVAAGAVWGVALFARPYDALLIALPLVVVALAVGWRTPRRLGAWFGSSALGAAIPLAALMAYNWILLGSPLRNSFTITGPDDALGFGRRGVFSSSSFVFTAHDGVISFIRNLSRLPSWTFGGFVLITVAGVGLWRSRGRGVAVWAVAGVGISFAVGYAFFWSPYSIVALWPGTRTLGPFYHLALLIPLALFGAAGLSTIAQRSRAATAAIVTVMVVVTVAGIVTKIQRNLPITRQYRSAQHLIDRAHLDNALLFIEDRGNNGFESAQPFLENRPDLNQHVIYATEAGPADFNVIRASAGRTPFRLRAELLPGDGLLDPTRVIERLRIQAGSAVPLRFQIVNTTGAPTVTARCTAGGKTKTVVLDRKSKKGAEYTVEWTLTAGASPSRSRRASLALPTSIGTAEIEADFSEPGRVTDRYQLLYPYTVASDRVSVLTPGWGRYLFRYRNTVWLNQDVSSTLAEARRGSRPTASLQLAP
jgi:4-amino-4-deoxy-L-arabinose transferase-like glycosyltransferase